MRKPNSNAVLKTLPEDRREMIVEYARDHSLDETVKWLRADGVKTSSAALSEFLSWHSLRAQLSQNASTVETLLLELKKAKPDISPAELDTAGQMFFTALSIEQRDSQGWKRAQDVKVKLGLLKLEWVKFTSLAAEKMLDARLRQVADELNTSSLSQADKIAAMRKAAFKDVEAFEASGKLKLPKP